LFREVRVPGWSGPSTRSRAARVAAALHGTGAARAGAELDVPAATVRGWLRHLRARTGEMRQEAMTGLARIAAAAGRDPALPEPSGSPLGDALSAVAACACAAIAWRGYTPADWDALLGRFGLARFLAPMPGS